MKRKELLLAAQAVVASRQDEYGQPEDSFAKIAAYWSTYLGRTLSSADVAMMMVLLKAARGHGQDCWVDIAGYAACGSEVSDVRGEDAGLGEGRAQAPDGAGSGGADAGIRDSSDSGCPSPRRRAR